MHFFSQASYSVAVSYVYGTKDLAARRVGITIGVISSIISFVLMILVLLAGRTEALNSGVLFIYQLFWVIPSLLTARMYVR